jgi:hypothetical protein
MRPRNVALNCRRLLEGTRRAVAVELEGDQFAMVTLDIARDSCSS